MRNMAERDGQLHDLEGRRKHLRRVRRFGCLDSSKLREPVFFFLIADEGAGGFSSFGRYWVFPLN